MPNEIQAKTTQIVESWDAPYTANWRQNFQRFVEACAEQERARLEAQFFYSHIILNQQWQEEMVWYDHSTGEIYEGEEQVPPDRKVMCSLRQRWGTQQQFIDWCEDSIPGFSRSTFVKRHRLIDKLYEVGMDFVDAVKIVAGLQIQAGGERILDIFEFNEFHEVEGFNPDLAKRLPGAEDIDDVPENEQLQAVSKAAMGYLKEQSIAVEDGASTPTRVSNTIKKHIHRRPRVKVRLALEKEGFTYVVIGQYPSDNNYDLGEEKKVYLQLVNENGEIIEDFPDGMREWWEEKLALPKR